MARVLCPLCLIALAVLALGASPAPAVSHGAATDDSAAPYMVYLGNCTGVLIAPDRVLTAAHCADVIDPGSSPAVIGTDDVGGNQGFVNGVLTPVIPPPSAVYRVAGFSAHPGFRLR